ncbi:MAG TPA: hypothetical protein VH765_12740 [Xanthobacteraceae bacterium]|jgi:hypothetical protein
MVILILVAAGLVLLAVFVLAARLLSRMRGGQTLDPAGLFTGVWLVVALLNGYNGWANYGIPLINEIGAFIPIFGIPAAAAWYWSRRGKQS